MLDSRTDSAVSFPLRVHRFCISIHQFHIVQTKTVKRVKGVLFSEAKEQKEYYLSSKKYEDKMNLETNFTVLAILTQIIFSIDIHCELLIKSDKIL